MWAHRLTFKLERTDLTQTVLINIHCKIPTQLCPNISLAATLRTQILNSPLCRFCQSSQERYRWRERRWEWWNEEQVLSRLRDKVPG